MLRVSLMTGKLKGLFGINFSPLCNEFCAGMAKKEDTVCRYCYSQKMLKTYRKNAETSFRKNAAYLSVLREYEDLPSFCKGSYVRFLAQGRYEQERFLHGYAGSRIFHILGIYRTDTDPERGFQESG